MYTGSDDGRAYIFDMAGELREVLAMDMEPGKRAVRPQLANVIRDVSWHPYYSYLVSTSWSGCVYLHKHEVSM